MTANHPNTANDIAAKPTPKKFFLRISPTIPKADRIATNKKVIAKNIRVHPPYVKNSVRSLYILL